MVLSRLTKITGPGISTDTNWVGDNANYTGIVTANSFVGDGSELVGVASTDNIITGTPATFNTYPVSMNAGVNVAGVATFTGNVSIAGTLTYEDVTNIDSVGIITARNDLKVGTGVTITPAGGGFFSGIVTATSFTGDGANITGVAVTEAPVLSYEIFGPNNHQYFWWGGGVDNTEPNPDLFLQRGQMYRFVNNAGSAHPLEIRYAQSGPEFTSGVRGDKDGVQLFTVPYDAPAKLRYQCVPHTNMGGAIYIRGADGNQEKVGLTTFRNAINIQSDDSSPGRIRFYCEVNNIHYVTLKAPAHANFSGYPVVTLPNITGTLLTSNNANISGIVTATGADINGDLDVDGHTNLDNVSIAGVTTFTGALSVNDDAQFTGGASAVSIGPGSDIRFSNGGWTGNSGTTGKIQMYNNTLYISMGANGVIFREDATDRWQLGGAGHFVPFTDSDYDIGHTSTRVRNIYADTYYGDGSNLTGISVDSTQIVTGNTSVQTVDPGSNGHVKVLTEGTEKLRVDNVGTLMVGHDDKRDNFNSAVSTEHAPIIQLEGVNQKRALSITAANGSDGGILMLARQNGSVGTNTVVSSGNQIGRVDFQASGGTNMEVAAQITAEVDGTPGDNDMPGRLLFKTTADGANSATERLRIDSNGTSAFTGTVTVNGYILSQGSSGRGGIFGQIQVGYSSLYNSIQNTQADTPIHLQYNNTGDIKCNEGGGDLRTNDIIPHTNNSANLGSNTRRWANIHTNDLNLSNEGNTNEVDGTWGKYTIQEGQDNLFLINRRSGKRYKFLLQEID